MGTNRIWVVPSWRRDCSTGRLWLMFASSKTTRNITPSSPLNKRTKSFRHDDGDILKKKLKICFYYSCGIYVVPPQQGRFCPKQQRRSNEPVERNERPCQCCKRSYDFCLVCGSTTWSTNVGLSIQTPRLLTKDYSSNQHCRILGTMDGVQNVIDAGKQKNAISFYYHYLLRFEMLPGIVHEFKGLPKVLLDWP
jgi:hypothetical protein